MRSLLYIVVLLVIAGCSISGNRSEMLDESQRLMQSDQQICLVT